MAPIVSGSPFRPRSRGPTARSPSPPPLPPKASAIDLNSSTRSTDRETGLKVTKRAFLCDVVVERNGPETTALLSHLGNAVAPQSALRNSQNTPTTPSRRSENGGAVASKWSVEKSSEMQTRLSAILDEFIKTERSYVARIKALKMSYADPLRHFAKQGYSVIVPMYEAKTLFSNIDVILPAAQSFLADLEAVWALGNAAAQVGDVCLRHLKTLKTIDPYRTYIGNQDEAQKTFQEMFKKEPAFVSFIENTKYQTTNVQNVGLSELLMEPVQRVPRYTLLWQEMIKCMSPLDTQRAKLQEATEIASRIARCDADEQTVRATVMYCLQRNVENFPANLFSNNRNFIDAIDVQDSPPGGDTATSGSKSPRPASVASSNRSSITASSLMSPRKESSSTATLPCTLFLFDDKIMITKRQSSSISGPKVTGVDDVAKLVKSGGGVAVKEKDGSKKESLSFRGVVDILNVVVTDVGNGDFNIDFGKPPMDQFGKWASRTFRHYSTVHPPYSVGFDPSATRKDKLRFVHNIWAAQALARTKVLPTQVKAVPQVLESPEEVDLGPAKEPFSVAKLYSNIWDREGWEAEQTKARVLIRIDEDGQFKDMPMGSSGNPSLIFHLQPLAGGICRLSWLLPNLGLNEQETMVPLDEIVEKVARRICRSKAFHPDETVTVANASAPNTPSTAGRRHNFGRSLDAVTTNLFGSGTASSRGGYTSSGDAFGSTSTKRSRSVTSRTSTAETRGTSTDKRSVTSDGRSMPQTPRSPMSPSRAGARSPSTASRSDGHGKLSDGPRPGSASPAVPSRVAARIAAMEEKVNSDTSPIRRTPSRVPVPTLASSVLARDESSLTRDSSLSSLPQSPTKSSAKPDALSPRPGGYVAPLPPPLALASDSSAMSRQGSSVTERPLSPRPPLPQPGQAHPALGVVSPLPNLPGSARRPLPQPPMVEVDLTDAPPSKLIGLGAPPRLRITSGSARSSVVGDENASLRSTSGQKRQHMAEHLTPRKRSPSDSPMHRREGERTPTQTPEPRLPGVSSRKVSTSTLTPRGSRQSSATGTLTPSRRVSAVSVASVASAATVHTIGSATEDCDIIMSDHADLSTAANSVRQKVADARILTRRIRVDAKSLYKMTKENHWDVSRTPSLPRSPHNRNIRRQADLLGAYEDVPSVVSPGAPIKGDKEQSPEDVVRALVKTSDKLETRLKEALADTERVRMLARQAAEAESQHASSTAVWESQIQRSKEREDLVREHLGMREMELDEIYKAFNTELDSMYNDLTLPQPDLAAAAMRKDLQETKAQRNQYQLENSRLKQQLDEERQKREHWAKLLRAHGIPL
ncbi:Rho guanine nucleotide exchange factor gef2 [Vanrija pseudolonga]|uniref:Rho guanine nucleotide exchange factor gef2 n=1 Tax=Vanrija pseudolonga TaxID=143232 RepID=A0AAF0YB65_9TREE|nr:Rho guanine nucleotide exchange factor gef2 [Vanrija pseudolonga]